ncbi:conserved hypothetical protein [Leishmania braziliensis MHOM/BR/75/M2904]|uniref:Transmembrane protein n=2 Tax=Leishmania braziliensis TaxID=5660 RepID=A4H469_LEIBR|nr:conserved hypothetical protein [Leishmania braziliensis MHOM/BR/75/M2904]CAJ2466303.1 unnamed protein product [Leishmania braziliensis]CAM36858.1 conserved hypothetical protein [Leishmania braziliensis MHOM/BR/75/M2904]
MHARLPRVHPISSQSSPDCPKVRCARASSNSLMPRAYYKPFTAYEEAFGFHATRRNAYIMCSVFFGGLLLKCMLLMKYSSIATPSWTSPLEDDPRYQEMMERRLALAEDLSTQESMKRAIRTRRSAPPA